MIQIKAPDGSIVQFPEGTTDDTIKSVMSKNYPAPQSQSTVSGIIDSFSSGAALGFGDELTGLEAAILGRTPEGDWFNYEDDFDTRYTRARDAERNQNKQFQKANPKTAFATELAGGVLSPAGVTGAMSKSASLGSRILKGVGIGTGQGAVSGAGYSEADNARDLAIDSATGAAIGGAIGGAVPAIHGAYKAVRGPKQIPVNTQRTKELSQRASEAYKKFEDEKVTFQPEQLAGIKDRVGQLFGENGVFAPTSPKAVGLKSAVIDTLEARPRAATELEAVRKALRGLTQSTDAEEARAARFMRQAIDEFYDSVDIASIKEARAAHAAAKQAQQFDEMVKIGSTRADNVRGMQGEVGKELRKVYQGRAHQSPGVTKAMEDVVGVNPATMTESAVDFAASADPTGSSMANLVRGGMATGGAAAAAGVPGVGAQLLLSKVAQAAKTGKAINNIADLERVMKGLAVTELEKQAIPRILEMVQTGGINTLAGGAAEVRTRKPLELTITPNDIPR